MDIVLGLLAPDTSNGFIRENEAEVFVGKLVPTDIHNTYFVWGMQDSLLKELMINTRQFYVAYYKYDPDAIVTIEGNGQSVQLTYMGRGIYRDVNRELKIKASVFYSLNVQKKDGRLFSSLTKVLNPIAINNITSDTVLIKPLRPQLGDAVRVEFTNNERAIYYILVTKFSNIDFLVNGYTFQNYMTSAVLFVKSGYDTTHIDYVTEDYEARAVDSAYGLFHQPHGHSMTPEFGDWDISLYGIPIEDRSNIKGKDVAGVFGNYTADRRTVTYKADWGN
jgi:hypothetical protein